MPKFFTNLKQYRTAMFNAYGEENITIEGEGFTSIVNGKDCYNPNGEENFRGPFGFFFTNCNNIAFENFSSERHGNFHFCLTGCDGVKVNKMQMLAGHDGVFLMMSKNIKVVDCIIHTGDDSISGCYLQNFYMNHCDVNTSCNAFRTSGENLVVENSKIWGTRYLSA